MKDRALPTCLRNAAVLDVLRAADLAPERRGRARLERLSPRERQLYDWILCRFAQAAVPSGEEARAAARGLGLDPDDALATLAENDLVHSDDEGRPVVAYPFSAVERGHRVTIDGVGTVEAMCAIDALGMAQMLARSIEVVSHDPLTGGVVRVRLDPEGRASWEPESAVVLVGSESCGGPSLRSCCDVLRFYETTESAERYLRGHPEVAGRSISISLAIEAGSAIFGELLAN